MYRDTTNVEPEMYDCTSNNWSHWNSNEKLKEKFGNCTRKTFDRFTTKNTWNITHNTESIAVWNLKPEQWGSPLVQEKYQEEKACDKRHPYRIIIIIIIIIIIMSVSQCKKSEHKPDNWQNVSTWIKLLFILQSLFIWYFVRVNSFWSVEVFIYFGKHWLSLELVHW